VVVSRTFNDANELSTSGDGSGTTTYMYDDNGNLTAISPPNAGPVTAYSYDQRNMLVTAALGSELQAGYVYDGQGNRLQQVDYTGTEPITTSYTNDIIGLTQVLVADDGTGQVNNLFGLDLIHQDDGSQTLTLLADGLGSVRTEMSGGVVNATTTYEPYGEYLSQQGTSGSAYGFTGEQEDSATGLLYLRARYFAPYLNRFLTADSIVPDFANPRSLNPYAYAFNNPSNLTDPEGLCPAPLPENGYYGDGGVICFAGFIPTAYSEGPFGLVFEGDDRWFTPNGSEEDSRAWFWIDVDTGDVIRYFVHPTTAVNDLPEIFGRQGGQCNGRRCTYPQPEWRTWYVSTLLEESGIILFSYSFFCSHPLCYALPGPEGSLIFIPGDRSFYASGIAEEFPNLEAYYWENGTFKNTIFQINNYTEAELNADMGSLATAMNMYGGLPFGELACWLETLPWWYYRGSVGH
jgi:RHS repeat-associated protein